MIPKGISSDSLSLSTYYLRMKFSETDTILATGTGFVYEFDQVYYMITNGHNVTGVNPETKQRLSSHIGFPDVISSKAKGVGNDGNYYFHPELFSVSLYKNNDTSKPLWFIHPKYGYDVDVVAIPLVNVEDVPNHIKMFPINKFHFDNDVFVEVSDDAFILGYPYEIKSGRELPVWKKGSIATEPSIGIDNLPKMLIDTATRPGMSGSPVIFKRSGLIKKEPFTQLTGDDIIGTVQGFLGIYSGRIHAKDKFEAQLGIVWRAEVIEEILSKKILGTIEFQNY